MKFYHPAGAMSHNDVINHGGVPSDIRIVLIGEFRAPLAGEWYVSGSIPEGYKATNDMSTEHHIGRLIQTRAICGRISVER